jgi:hypothetical protein
MMLGSMITAIVGLIGVVLLSYGGSLHLFLKSASAEKNFKWRRISKFAILIGFTCVLIDGNFWLFFSGEKITLFSTILFYVFLILFNLFFIFMIRALFILNFPKDKTWKRYRKFIYLTSLSFLTINGIVFFF